ncbi:degV domain-containing protein SP_1112-like [Vulpes lagopus]|uniref:degV domain-containing protein SP_1112-like n=1 Tax=Vulpes lagopus TaxID=494514 RepID=UPI001BC8D283|nr:degV domain-containing protein SP_1112-like [Vulpes lagopus]
MIDGVVYSDNDLKEEGKFLNMMRHSRDLPKTSQPPVGIFAEAYEKLMKEGAEHIVSIHIAHTLSGTVEAARQGANLSGANVTVIDSTFTDQCQTFQVVQAAKLAQEGASLSEVVAKNRRSSNYGVSGNTSNQILKRMQEQTDIQEALAKANLMTLTVGGNDVMAVIRKNLANLSVSSFTESSKDYQKRLRQIY